MTFTEKQKLAIKRGATFCDIRSGLLMISIKIAQDYSIELNRSYKKKVEEIEQKERKRLHNKKKSDRMKRLRVKKEKKRA